MKGPSKRYGLAPAPGGLGLVQDFLNSQGRLRLPEEELLRSPAAAGRWLATVRGAPKLTARDLTALRRLRTALRDGKGIPLEVKAAVSLDSAGKVQLSPAGAGWRFVASLLLLEMSAARQAGTWQRLKVCRNPKCAVAFYDRSRNNSAVWHSATVCGNAFNLRASRARQRAR
jgi:hypothetical protein